MLFRVGYFSIRIRAISILAAVFIVTQFNNSYANLSIDNKCQSIYRIEPATDPVPFGTMRPIGNGKYEFNHNSNYTVEVPAQSEIKNQCDLGTCHLHSWISLLEHDYLLKHPNGLRLSTHYLNAQLWLQRSLAAIDSKYGDPNITLEADVLTSKKSIEQFGIIPDEAWLLNRNFHKSPYARRMQEYIENIVANNRWQQDQEFDEHARKEIRKEGKRQIHELFESMIGPLPTHFEYKGQSYTPQTFLKAFFPRVAEPLIRVRVNASPTAPNHMEKNSRDSVHAVYNMNIDSIEKITRMLLDQGENVYLSYDHNDRFVDLKTGVMSLKAFSYPKYATPISREMREHFNKKPNGHAVQIVGYDLDPATNRVIKWKIKNSWGDDKGDRGFYHMYSDYFREYAMEIAFSNNEKIILPK